MQKSTASAFREEDIGICEKNNVRTEMFQGIKRPAVISLRIASVILTPYHMDFFIRFPCQKFIGTVIRCVVHNDDIIKGFVVPDFLYKP